MEEAKRKYVKLCPFLLLLRLCLPKPRPRLRPGCWDSSSFLPTHSRFSQISCSQPETLQLWGRFTRCHDQRCRWAIGGVRAEKFPQDVFPVALQTEGKGKQTSSGGKKNNLREKTNFKWWCFFKICQMSEALWNKTNAVSVLQKEACRSWCDVPRTKLPATCAGK